MLDQNLRNSLFSFINDNLAIKYNLTVDKVYNAIDDAYFMLKSSRCCSLIISEAKRVNYVCSVTLSVCLTRLFIDNNIYNPELNERSSEKLFYFSFWKELEAVYDAIKCYLRSNDLIYNRDEIIISAETNTPNQEDVDNCIKEFENSIKNRGVRDR